MKFTNKNLYIEYIKTLDVQDLSDEYNYLKAVKDNLFDIYNTLLEKLKNNIVSATINNLYDNLIDLKKYLMSTVKDFLNNKNLNLSNKSHETISEKTIIKEIIKLYEDIFVTPKPQDPFFGFEPMNYKELKVSYYDVVMNLYVNLNKVISKHLNNISDNKVNDIIEEVISTAEEYMDIYIIFEHRFKELLTTEQYNILLKYDCLKRLTCLASEESVVAVDIIDLCNFFKNATITKIINNGKEITLSNQTSNQLIFLMHSENGKLDHLFNRIQFYKQKYTLEIDENIMGLYYGKEDELVIYMHAHD